MEEKDEDNNRRKDVMKEKNEGRQEGRRVRKENEKG